MFVALMYHLVSNHISHAMVIPKKSFDQQLELLYSLALNVIPSQKAIDSVHRGFSNPSIVLTFDDGYANTTDYVSGRLDKFGYTATMAVNSTCLRKETTPKTLPHVSNEFANVRSVSKWIDQGRTIAGHGSTHRKLTTLTDDEIVSEVSDDAKALRRNFGSVDTFCYPFGSTNDKVTAIVNEEYKAAYVTDRGSWPNAANIFEMRRLQVRPEWNLGSFESAVQQAMEEAHAGSQSIAAIPKSS